MEEQIKTIVLDVINSPDQHLDAEADLLNEVGLDSLQVIDFLLKVEEEFDVELDFEDLDRTALKNVKTFSEFIQKNMSKA